ncbi:MAG: cation transporter, partial [Paracoccaceae bacterium]
MGKSCCQTPETDQSANNNPRWRMILWIALIANAAMFVVEIVAGIAADSRALQADALDFFGDAANYAISLGVAGMALSWRARAALFKAATMFAFGLWVIGYAVY